MNKSSCTVCAVIVTYNRRFLLARCLSSILSQTICCKKVVVIDNASSDGSQSFIESKFLAEFKSKQVDFVWIRQKENGGGAGGFSAGISAFLSSSEDYVWLMDDDGYAAPDCLAMLSKYANEKCYCGPIVLSDRDKLSLAFPFRKPNSLSCIDSLKDLDSSPKVIKNIILPFNGTLISRKIVERIGFPEGKYYIWGDEVDYTERAKKADASVFTVAEAIFYHPKTQNLGSPMFFGKLRFNDPTSRLKLYCYCRNNFVNLKKYKSPILAYLFVCKAVWYYSFTNPSLNRLALALKAFCHGQTNDFSHHKEFIDN
ncbi:glycosyltransferase [Turicimonas muris]|uniref:glycosyltransferase n=1 Tax=Turicimonas muris TaxID=1796652 RepID=UPI0032B1597C